ncbi:glycosyltransferase family 2 protein [Dokdonella sp.]|uniref:glycosyltransferase family 2 protein n=1 Tax=Dokdonella sp. TaxID=2291710 RepID=UPI0025BE6250|nr:glycosyltransferase family 2 protein [Dokdonella sp.]MBX3689847.1 glycosyltransferase family 2 protein [Dokdonella sp.]
MSDVVPVGLTSVIIVAADSGPLLRDCVASVLAEAVPLEVILVDNASRDGEVERVAAAHAGDPRLHVLHNAANLGFGPACNRGAAMASGDELLFLNPDCLWRLGTLESLRAILADDARIGLLGLCVLDAQGVPARGNRRREPTLRRAVMTFTGLADMESHSADLGGVEMPVSDGDAPLEYLEAVSGACMLLPRAVFERIGGFDEGYFLHVEDLDLCRRVRDAGWYVAYAAHLTVTHAQGGSSRARPVFVARAKHRGMWRYFRKFDPAADSAVLRVIVWLGIWAHFLFKLPALAMRGVFRARR